MTNREELFGLSNRELAKRLIKVRYDNNDQMYFECPDGVEIINADAAVLHTMEWLTKDVNNDVEIYG